MELKIDVVSTLTTRGRWVVQQEGAEPFTEQEVRELGIDADTPNALFFFRPDPDNFVRHPGDTRPWEAALTQQHDALEVSAKLSRLKTPDEALDFLRRFGPLSAENLSEIPKQPIAFRDIIATRNGHDSFLLRRQPPVRSVTVGSTEASQEFWDYWKYMANPPAIDPSLDNGLQGVMRCPNVLQALKAAVFLAKAGGLEWMRCGRDKCRAPFAVTGKRTKYCSRQCANHQSVLDHYKNNGRPSKASASAKA